jgi:Holliday junction resolvasome RuvABC endonuclease subunit
MKVLTQVRVPKRKRVVGVDGSTHNLAICVVEKGKPVQLISLDLPKGDLQTRLSGVHKRFNAILDLVEPDFVMVESPIFIQNPQTTKNLSYVVGIIFSSALERGIAIEDVSPSTWKAHFGYKRVTKQLQQKLVDELGQTAARKEVQRLRKSQIQDKMREAYPDLDWSNDNLADSAGIALYTWSLYGTMESNG